MSKQTQRKRKKDAGVKASELRKAATRITGLDEVLNGGLPEGRTTLVSGGPGSGKSVLGLEFLYRGAVDGDPGIFVTFEERAKAVRQNALTLGFDLAHLEKAGTLFLMDGHVNPELVLSGDFNLKGLFGVIEGKVKAMGARRIVFDAVDVLLRLFDDPVRERNELYALHDWLTDRQMTALITVKTSKNNNISSRYEFLDFMADCVIELDQRVLEQTTTRRIRVVKYRGSDFFRNEYPFVIAENGIKIIPLSTISLKHQALGPKLSSGHPRLDYILDGGYRRSSATLISGTSGTGKTTVACTFVQAACARGERTLYINFEESPDAMVSGMLSPGIDLRPALKAGTLRIMATMPEIVGAEEHLLQAIQAMDAFEPSHVVVDAISACKRIGTEQASFEYLMRLTNTCKERGITTIFTNQTEGFQETHEISGTGISSVIDTVIFLRYIDIGGELNRMLLVMKSRGSKHSNQYREFQITDHGIEITDVFVGKGGVLTGTARQEQEAKEKFALALEQREFELKEKEIIQKRAALQAHTANLNAEIEAAEAELAWLRLKSEIAQKDRDIRGNMRGEETDSKRLGRAATPGKHRTGGPKGGAK